MRPLHQRQLVVFRAHWRCGRMAYARVRRRRFGDLQQLRLRHPILDQPLCRRELPLQLLLPHDRRDGAVDAEHLVVARHDLARAAGPAVVEQDEVLDQIEQPVLRQHPVEQRLGIQARLVLLVVALPLDEVLPLAGDRAVAGLVAVAHDQEGVVVEGVGDAVLGEVVGQVVVEAGADVPIDRLQLDEHQRQAVDEADEIGAPVVVRHAHALDLQLAHGEEAVAGGVAEVDHLRVRVTGLAARIPPLDRHAAADEAVELAVVLDQRAGEVDRG